MHLLSESIDKKELISVDSIIMLQFKLPFKWQKSNLHSMFLDFLRTWNKKMALTD